MSFVDDEKKHCYHTYNMRLTKHRFGRRFVQSILLKLRWLLPGIGVKRWLMMILAGTTLLGVGFAVLILDVYRNVPDTWWLPIISYASLRFLDRTLRAVIFGGLGIALLGFGIMGLNRSLLKPFIRPGANVIETVSEYRRRERGPRIVVIGGGTGLSALLRGLKEYSRNITAVVTVADNGGSSGELRKNIGILPPGDIRNCLAALSKDEELLTQLFQYRFAEGAGLNGHSMGNLLITALTELTGSFEEGVAEMGRVLAVQGDVFPSTLHNVNLCADVKLEDRKVEVQIEGESQISSYGGKILRVWLEPGSPAAFPPTVQAILGADLIIIGPGSLYTSLLANLLVPDLRDAIRASRATKFYVCNVATQPGETDHFTCNDHLKTIERHIGGRLIDVAICNTNFQGSLPQGVDWVKLDPEAEMEAPVYKADLIDTENPWRHDSAKLARTVMDLYLEKTGPLNPRDGNSPL